MLGRGVASNATRMAYNILRNDALCIFYNEEITEEAAKRLALELDLLSALDIYYAEEPRKPMLQTKVKINGNPAFHHRYARSHPEPVASVGKVFLKNRSQLINYMNQVYLCSPLPEQKVFESELMLMKEIFQK